MAKLINHRDVQRACVNYNKIKGFTEWNSIGRLQFGDVTGNGGKFKPRLYVVCNDSGGLTLSDKCGATYRETIENINNAAKESTS